MTSAQRPIGIFDSGIGGLTVARALAEHLPHEQLIYVGDTAHFPYGEKSHDALRYYCLKIAKFLLEKQCKLIVVACNSAATAAYEVMLEFFSHSALFVNVVDPLTEEVISRKFKKVGIIATKATITSGIYQKKLRELQPELEVAALATPLLAPMIEEGFVHNAISRTVLENYLLQPLFTDIEGLLLACTHYPLIREDIQQVLGTHIPLFDSTHSATQVVASLLAQHNLLNTAPRPPHHFYVSDYTDSFAASTRLFYGQNVQLEHLPLW